MPIRGIAPSEFDELNEMLEAAFKGAELDHRFIKLNQEKPIIENYGRIFEYDPEIDEGLNIESKKFIAYCGIVRQNMQYGRSLIVHGGIRDVGTHPIARGKGFGLKVMQNAINFMFSEKIDVSILFSGANHFYHKSGWRGGVSVPIFGMNEEDIQRIENYQDNTIDFSPNNFKIRFIEKSDFEIVSNIYEDASIGEYFVNIRDVEFWQLHFKVRPKRYWDYVVIEKDEKIIGYFSFKLNNISEKENGIELILEEIKISPFGLSMGDPIPIIILQAILYFLKKEALNEGDSIQKIQFKQSKNDPIIKYLLNQGYKLVNQSGLSFGTMILITNPYSFFERIKSEIEYKLKINNINKGSFWIQFDLSNKYPGGLYIEIQDYNLTNYTIFFNNERFEDFKKIYDGIEFDSISDLTQIVCGLYPLEELEDYNKDDGDILINIHRDGVKWLNILFSNISYDLYNLDHF